MAEVEADVSVAEATLIGLRQRNGDGAEKDVRAKQKAAVAPSRTYDSVAE